MGDPAGPPVSVVVRDASCATPACYTAATDESYNMTISVQDGVQITARTLIGVSHAFSTLASLANPEAEVACLPIQGETLPAVWSRKRLASYLQLRCNAIATQAEPCCRIAFADS